MLFHSNIIIIFTPFKPYLVHRNIVLVISSTEFFYSDKKCFLLGEMFFTICITDSHEEKDSQVFKIVLYLVLITTFKGFFAVICLFSSIYGLKILSEV